jgi:hypothetical protein
MSALWLALHGGTTLTAVLVEGVAVAVAAVTLLVVRRQRAPQAQERPL